MQGQRIFLPFKTSGVALGSNQPPTQWGLGPLLGIKRPESEADRSPPERMETTSPLNVCLQWLAEGQFYLLCAVTRLGVSLSRNLYQTFKLEERNSLSFIRPGHGRQWRKQLLTVYTATAVTYTQPTYYCQVTASGAAPKSLSKAS